MLSFVAFARDGAYCGAWSSCMNWCRAQVAKDPRVVAHVLLARAGEKHGRVVAEVTSDGERRVSRGRLVPLKKVPAWRG